LAALFIALDALMAAPEGATARDQGWTIERAEALLGSLTGIVSVRIVAKPGGAVEEIHILTTEEISPKQTVRNVESALLAHLNLSVDHRKISVAQTKDRGPQPAAAESHAVLQAVQPALAEDRVLFLGHQVESARSHHVRMRVALEWKGERFEGDAEGADLPRARLEAIANATLRALESAIGPELSEPARKNFALSLDGAKLVDAFDHAYVLVAVNAISGRDVTALAGSALTGESPDKAVILATLQATDRWVRGRI
jgi:hypothetical protein